MNREEILQALEQILSRTRDGKKKTALKVSQITKLLDIRYDLGYRDGFNEGRNETYDELATAKRQALLYQNTLKKILESGDEVCRQYAEGVL